jgi:hypothetical protein
VGLVVALEELGRELTGAPPPAGGETGLWVAAAVQVVLALVAVTTVLLLVVPVRLLAPVVGTGTDDARLPSYRGVVLRVGRTGTWERGPPRGPALATPSS